jgi:DNA-binding NarL/FixJ family response regulator
MIVTPASPIVGTGRRAEDGAIAPIAIDMNMPENARKTPSADVVGDVGVLTVDDQPVFRSVARDVIEATPGFHAVGEAASGEEALDAVDRLHPDLVLMDVRMPGIGGAEAACRIASAHPETVVVLISIEDQEELARDVRVAGVAELVRKQDFGPALLRRLWDAHGASA